MHKKRFISSGILMFFLLFILLGLFFTYEMAGVDTSNTSKSVEYSDDPYLPDDFLAEELEEQKVESLILTCSTDEDAVQVQEQFEQILSDMRVGYELLEIGEIESEEAFRNQLDQVDTAILTTGSLDLLQDDVFNYNINDWDKLHHLEVLLEWVNDGGHLLCAQPLDTDNTFKLYADQFGITECEADLVMTDQLYFSPAFMAGGGSYTIEDPYKSAIDVELSEDCSIYAWVDNEKCSPILWTYARGKGNIVMTNWGYYDKNWRGIYSSAYSLLQDAFAYPVINTSTIFLDDFPSPVPEGYDSKLKHDMNVSISDYYTNVWLPDVLKIGDDYGIRFTAPMIETYDDDVSGSAEVNSDTSSYKLFGSIILDKYGEIAIHGYNHQPLCIEGDETINTDQYAELGYVFWPDESSIVSDFSEVLRFAKELYPTESPSVYIPPSNIISEKGREILHENFPEIKTIASMYFEEDDEPGYTQEFGIGEDGIVDMPRITSDCQISDFMRLAIFSELNYHMANLHFIHPDDVLDVDRGKNLGWDKMRTEFISYLDQVYDTMPNIRNLTASEAAGAVQRYSHLSVKRTLTENSLHLQLDGLYDESYLMVRLNQTGEPKVVGGRLELITGNLYLLHAKSDDIWIKWGD